MGKQSTTLNTVFWNTFSSLKLTIFLLILLAATSVLGTIILQNGTPQQYLAEYGPNLTRIFDFFGLFDMYHSWWFLAILALLVLNLVFCSLNRLPVAWRQIFHPRVELSRAGIQSQPYTRSFRDRAERKGWREEVERKIPRSFGKPKHIEESRRLLLFAEKGRYGRLGVYVAHLSVIVILLGGMMGSLFGFKGILKITEGQTVGNILLRKNGRYVKYPLGYQVRCDDFDISYYDIPGPEKFVSEYTSTLTVVENGAEVRREKVRVNHPLKHQGLKFYQSSYGTETEVEVRVRKRDGEASHAFRIREGERLRIPGSDTMFQLLGYSQDVHNLGEGVQVGLLSQGQPPQRIWLFKGNPDYDERRGGDFIFTISDIRARDYTVLQVSRDPGVVVVWVGCALLITGLVMAFFIPHRRLWVDMSGGKGKPIEVILGGTTNRNQVNFEREFTELAHRLEEFGMKPV